MSKLVVCECACPQGVHALLPSLAYGACQLCDCPGFVALPIDEEAERNTHYWHQRQEIKKLWSLCYDCAIVRLEWMMGSYDLHLQRAAAHLVIRNGVPGYEDFLKEQGFERPAERIDSA